MVKLFNLLCDIADENGLNVELHKFGKEGFLVIIKRNSNGNIVAKAGDIKQNVDELAEKVITLLAEKGFQIA